MKIDEEIVFACATRYQFHAIGFPTGLTRLYVLLTLAKTERSSSSLDELPHLCYQLLVTH